MRSFLALSCLALLALTGCSNSGNNRPAPGPSPGAQGPPPPPQSPQPTNNAPRVAPGYATPASPAQPTPVGTPPPMTPPSAPAATTPYPTATRPAPQPAPRAAPLSPSEFKQYLAASAQLMDMFTVCQVLTPAEKEYIARVAYQAASGDYDAAGFMMGVVIGGATKSPSQARQVFFPQTPQKAAAWVNVVRQDTQNQRSVDALHAVCKHLAVPSTPIKSPTSAQPSTLHAQPCLD